MIEIFEYDRERGRGGPSPCLLSSYEGAAEASEVGNERDSFERNFFCWRFFEGSFGRGVLARSIDKLDLMELK